MGVKSRKYDTGLGAADVVSALRRSGIVPELCGELWESDEYDFVKDARTEYGVRMVMSLRDAADGQLHWEWVCPGWPQEARDRIEFASRASVWWGLRSIGLVSGDGRYLSQKDLALAEEIYDGRDGLPDDERDMIECAVADAESDEDSRLWAGLIFRPDDRGGVEIALMADWTGCRGESLATVRVRPRGQSLAGRCAWVMRAALKLLEPYGLGKGFDARCVDEFRGALGD